MNTNSTVVRKVRTKTKMKMANSKPKARFVKKFYKEKNILVKLLYIRKAEINRQMLI